MKNRLCFGCYDVVKKDSKGRSSPRKVRGPIFKEQRPTPFYEKWKAEKNNDKCETSDTKCHSLPSRVTFATTNMHVDVIFM